MTVSLIYDCLKCLCFDELSVSSESVLSVYASARLCFNRFLVSDCRDILAWVLQLVASRVGCYIYGIRAGIGSSRIHRLLVA